MYRGNNITYNSTERNHLLGKSSVGLEPSAGTWQDSLMNSAAITVLAEAGIQGMHAESALRHLLAELAAPSAEAEVALRQLGLAPEDVDPSLRRITTIVRRLTEAGLDEGNAIRFVDERAASTLLALGRRIERLEELSRA